MDNFMDKITQKLNSQDMIRANAAADAAELENLENQVTVFKEQIEKYDDCLQEMRQLNLRNIESAKEVKDLTRQAGESLEKTAGEVESASVSRIKQTSDLSIAGINQTVAESLAKIAEIQDNSGKDNLEKMTETVSGLKNMQDEAFKSLEDFLQRTEEGDLNKRVVENLIKCGAMDCFGLYRSQLLAMYEPAMEAVADSRRRNVEGQLGMFAMLEEEGPSLGIPVPKMNEISRADRMAMEKETTGLYLSGHPMDDYRPYLKNTHVLPIGSLMDEERTVEDESIVSVA